MLDQDRSVLMTLYQAWRSQTISVVGEEELIEKVGHLGGAAELLDCVNRLVEEGYLGRSPTSIYLTSKGMEYGVSAGRPSAK
ncbi:hypothetical protein G3545_04495 [Starkeya sp. ORNL1]|uniref:hypothetical protein n=1 Tax=Starkeya sp. ORNL1 TaxID=2709380 RepID=UPI001462AA18|nr:hypothetical protein [Starkeya sp. ORNL1]QJP12979.1 hypothetical protein G3545_04495 [Starkeya sp. ORNL1]